MTTIARPSPTAVEAASWALAAEIAGSLGPEYTIIECHGGSGIYDELRVVDQAALRARTKSPVCVLLNRAGALHLDSPASNDRVRFRNETVWSGLVSGEEGVTPLSAAVLVQLGLVSRRAPRVQDLAWRVIASVTAQAALYGLPWTARHAVTDAEGYPYEVRQELLRPYAGQIEPGLSTTDALRYWLILGPDEHPIACIDTEGHLLRPDASGITAIPINTEPIDLALAASLATELTEKALTTALRAQAKATSGTRWLPGLGLPSVLSAFNRKERFFLTTQAAGLLTHGEIHGPSLPLAPPLLGRLGRALDVEVPGHAFAATDYHLSWLHAALAWWRGEAWPHQQDTWPATAGPEGSAWVDGSQEDIDLLVAWQGADRLHVIAVEAKAYGAWGNAQMTSKIARLTAIRDACQASDIDLRLVLTSRHQPRRLAEGWPEWATDAHGKPNWFPLSAPGLRLATTRCDESGQPSQHGKTWKITGPVGT